MKDETISILGMITCSFVLGIVLGAQYIASKTHTDKAGCEYVEQAPCKMICIKDEE